MKSAKHLGWVRQKPCCCCGREACAHHLIGKGTGHMGGKASDFATIPLCFDHHTGDQGIHPIGVKTWEREFGDQWEMLAKTLLNAIHSGWLVIRA